MRAAYWFLVWLGLGVALLAPAGAQAQDVLPIAVFDTDSRDEGATLGLDVFFVIRDSAGRPLPDARIESATLQVLDDPAAQATFRSAGEADSPLYIAMLLDTSGSMAEELPEVLAAARLAIDQAPANARIAISRFSSQVQTVQGFSDDRYAVRLALDRIAQPEGDTCLYDAIYSALEDLQRTIPAGDEHALRTVVVFTDGEDLRLSTGQPCSVHTLGEVVSQAQTAQIPINTIGMYTTNPDSINRSALAQLAQETAAFSAIGSAASVGNLFEQIFTGINSQYRASFDLLVGAGPKRGLLQVQLENEDEPLFSGPFRFVSPRIFAPAPTAEPTQQPTPEPTPLIAAGVVVDGVRFDAGRGLYEVALSIGNAAVIDRLIVTLVGDNGIIADEQVFDLNGQAAMAMTIDSRNLDEGREYRIQVKGIDAAGICIPRPPDPNDYAEQPDCLLGQHEFKHELPAPPPVEASILPVVAQAASKVLQIPLQITREEEVEQFSGTIVDVGTGQEIGHFGPDVYEAGQALTVPMPPVMLTPPAGEANDARRYAVTVVLKTKDDQIVTTDPYVFVVDYPPPVPWHEQLFASLEQNPLILGGIALVVLLLSAYFLLSGRKEKQAFSLAGGAQVEDYTVIGSPVAASGGKKPVLAVKVIQTPQPTDRRTYTINDFPCTIGRSSTSNVRFAGDRQVSRTHVSIGLKDGEFTLSDLGSDNGTWVDGKRLAPKQDTKLRDFQTLKLGPSTTLEIRIQY